MSREITQRDLEDLGDERFEQLIASLVFAEHENAERPDAPDGGADVLVPAADGFRTRVWQVKHYTSSIVWKKCEDSLDAAVTSYTPESVTFVFPRNLTQPQRDKFEARLVERHRGISVTCWGLHRIQELLARHPDIATRYFGEDRTDVLPGLLRAVAQGGKELEDTRDIVDRAFELDAFADDIDPSFKYEVSFGSADTAPKVWSDTPFMVVEQVRDGRRVGMEAYLRPEAVSEAVAGFTDDEAGARSRDATREAFAAGKPVEVTEGLWLRVTPAPVAAKEALDAIKEQGVARASAKLSPGEANDFEMRLEKGGEVLSRTFKTRPLPPLPGTNLSYGGAQDGVALFLNFILDKPPTVSVNFQLSFRETDDAAVNASATQFLVDFYEAERVTCFATGYLPDEGLPMGGETKPVAGEAEIEYLRIAVLLYGALAVIEENYGHQPVPEQFGREDVDSALAAAYIIKTGRGVMTFEEFAIESPFTDVDRVINAVQQGQPGRHPVKLTIFSRELDLGVGEFEPPPVSLVATEKGSKPDTALLRFRTQGPTEVPFKLLPEPPSEPPAVSAKLWTPAQGPAGFIIPLREER